MSVYVNWSGFKKRILVKHYPCKQLLLTLALKDNNKKKTHKLSDSEVQFLSLFAPEEIQCDFGMSKQNQKN